MRNVLAPLLLLASIQTLCAQEIPAGKQTFIPENWKLVFEATGDLNKDSLADVAMIIEYEGESLENERPRSLVILFRDKKTKLYTQEARADHVILDGQSGGTLGDPFSQMEIKNNVLRIDFVGGSRERWATTHRYRFTGTYGRLIGATYKVEEMGVTKTYDYNLSNGNIIITTRNSQDKAKNTTVNKKPQLLPIGIGEFEPDAIWALLSIPDLPKTVTTCTLQDVGFGDCSHVNFDCGDFGNAKLFLDEASKKLWDDLSVDNNGEEVVNPAYRGKKFEITYVTNTGVRCEPQGEDLYQLIIGFKLATTTSASY